jgi:hypothetical protein
MGNERIRSQGLSHESPVNDWFHGVDELEVAADAPINYVSHKLPTEAASPTSRTRPLSSKRTSAVEGAVPSLVARRLSVDRMDVA